MCKANCALLQNLRVLGIGKRRSMRRMLVLHDTGVLNEKSSLREEQLFYLGFRQEGPFWKGSRCRNG